jgi:spermidine synthase
MIGQLGSGTTLQILLGLNAALIALSFRVRPVPLISTLPARILAGSTLMSVLLALVFFFPTDLFFANQLAAVSRKSPGPKRILFRGEDAASLAIVVEEELMPFRFVRDQRIEQGRHREIYHSNWRGTGGIVGGTRIYLWNVASAYLGALLHPDPESVLVIGYGSGRQTITMAGFREPKKIDVVEVNALNFAASEHFYLNPEFLRTDPRITVYVDDGRNHLLRSDALYDLIMVDTGGLFADGSEFLYTREFLDLCRSHLKPGGYLFTWLDMRKLLGSPGWMYQNTFRDVFPESSVWLGTKEPTSFQWLWLVGVNGEMAFDYGLLRQRWDGLTPEQRLELSLTGIQSPEDLLSLFVTGLRDELPELIGRTRILTDDRPFYAKAWEPDPVDMRRWFAPVLYRDHDYYEAGFGHIFGGRSLPPLRNVSSLESMSLKENRDAHFRHLRQMTTDVLARFLEEEISAERLSEGLLREYLRTAPSSDAGQNPVVDAVRQVLSARGAALRRSEGG